MKRGNSTFRRAAAGAMTAVMLVGCAGVTASAAGAESFTLGVYSTTDMHGKCYNLNPVDGKEVGNSMLKVATAMEQERSAVDGVLLIDNGDLVQGTPITRYNVNSEAGRNNPMALCLRYIGYDAFVMGNHEFNFTLEVQNNIYDLLESTQSDVGTPVSVVCANYINTETQETDRTPYIIKEYTVGGKTFRVGFLGFENVNVPNWDPSSHYEGHDFVHADNTERTYAYEWTNYWQEQMREEENCDIVILGVHSGEESGLVGAGEDGAVSTGNTAFEPENQVRHLIENTTGIDMVIAGHNHQAGTYTFQNADGQDVTVVNGGGQNLTKTTITLNSDGTFAFGESELVDLTTYENDPGLQALMEPYYEDGLASVDEVVGTVSGDWDDVTDLFVRQSDTMDLVHKAQIWATGADLSIASPVAASGFCVGQLIPEGADSAEVSLKNCYSIYRYDNNLLYELEITGKQIKDWLESVTKDYTVEEDGTISGGGFGTDQIYGVDYDIYLGNPEGSRVVNLTYQGQPVTDDQVFTAAVNSYRLSATPGADSYGWYAATGITATSDAVLWKAETSEQFGEVGGSVPYIIGEYFKAMTAQGQDVTPGSESHWTLNAGTAPETDAVTRLTFVEKLYEAMGSPALEGAAPAFKDLKDSAAMDWAAANGIVSGDGAGNVMPGQTVTREQAAVILMNAATVLEKGPTGAWAVQIPYADGASISAWAGDGVMWNVIEQYIPVGEDNLFQPQGTITSAEADAMIAALLAE